MVASFFLRSAGRGATELSRLIVLCTRAAAFTAVLVALGVGLLGA